MSITHPITISIVGPATITITGGAIVGGGDPPAATTWDANNMTANTTLSDGDLTASSASDVAPGEVKTTTSRSSGKRAARFTLNYGEGQFVGFGVAAVGALVPGQNNYLAALFQDGYFDIAEEGSNDIGLTVPTGGDGFIYYDPALGYVWVDNASDSTASDREAGINPHYTVTPFAPLALITNLGSAEGAAVSATLDPTYSSGSFQAWDS
ncbi:hypothetical protein [Arenimonas sp.]|uniref:hypothetical protein n=1 Tax=Arenimonas sp. TaxID=1872635 RepID=UPI0039E5A534